MAPLLKLLVVASVGLHFQIKGGRLLQLRDEYGILQAYFVFVLIPFKN